MGTVMSFEKTYGIARELRRRLGAGARPGDIAILFSPNLD
jgi:hypothetical protein